MARIFNEKKAAQAAARFINLSGGTINYTILIKDLYLLDRAALLNWGRLVTCADLYEMKLGPVLSQVHDLITEQQEEQSIWSQCISRVDFDVALKENPGNDALSESEEEMIDQIFSTYGHFKDPFAFARFLHKILPELKGIERGRLPLTVEDILRAERKSPEEIESIASEIEAIGQVEAMLAAKD